MTTNHKDGPTKLSVAVAEEIEVWMLRRRMTGQRLASQLGKSPAWVSYRINGQVDIKLSELEAIAEALDVPIADLLPRPALRDQRNTFGSSGHPGQTSPNRPVPIARHADHPTPISMPARQTGRARRATVKTWTHAGVTP